MTIEQYIQKEAEKYHSVHGNGFHFMEGLSAGIELAKEFDKWKSENRWKVENYEYDKLFEIFLNERNEK